MNERLDALLSAQRDDALEASERAELDRLLSASEAARVRAASLEGVDERLRSLAAEPVADERLARSLAALRDRSGIAATRRHPLAVATAAATGIARRGRARGWGIAAAAAVAAVWIASLVLPPAGVETGAGIGEQPEAVRDAIATEDLAALGIDQVSDLEVIEELELLEFLADRDRDGDRDGEWAGEGPRG